jgi:hypothetical protein
LSLEINCKNLHQNYFTRKVITSVQNVHNRYIIILGCCTKVKVCKTLRSVLKCESSACVQLHVRMSCVSTRG